MYCRLTKSTKIHISIWHDNDCNIIYNTYPRLRAALEIATTTLDPMEAMVFQDWKKPISISDFSLVRFATTAACCLSVVHFDLLIALAVCLVCGVRCLLRWLSFVSSWSPLLPLLFLFDFAGRFSVCPTLYNKNGKMPMLLLMTFKDSPSLWQTWLSSHITN